MIKLIRLITKIKMNANITLLKVIFYVVPIVIVLAGFMIMIFRTFYPYHRAISIILIFIGIALLAFFVIRNNIPEGHLTKQIIVIGLAVVLFLLLSYVFFVVTPLDKAVFLKADITYLKQKVEDDSTYVTQAIKSTEAAKQSIIDSGLLKMAFEESDPEKAKELKEYYSRVLSNIHVLDNFIDEYKYFYQINAFKYPELNMRAFLIAYSSFITKYKTVFDLSKEFNQFTEGLLNEEIGEFGNKTFYSLKYGLNHPDSVIQLNTGIMYVNYGELTQKTGLILKELPKNSLNLLDHSKKMYSQLFGDFDHSIKLSIKGMLDVFEKNTVQRWLPLQKEIAIAMGEAKLTTRHDYFITMEQVKDLHNKLEPGDVLIERRNWHMSNIGIGGFWKHIAIYVGTLERLDEFFKDESQELFGKSVSEHLKEEFPNVYRDKSKMVDGFYLTTIEGKADGIIMLPLESSAKADYTAAIRPRLSKTDKLEALIFTFENYGKPYDYNFDFSTDDAMVCSELMYKAYLSTEHKKGLYYKLVMSAGRWLLPPNNIVQAFDETYGTDKQQTDFVIYLAGDEETQKAVELGVEDFRKTWKMTEYGYMGDVAKEVIEEKIEEVKKKID